MTKTNTYSREPKTNGHHLLTAEVRRTVQSEIEETLDGLIIRVARGEREVLPYMNQLMDGFASKGYKVSLYKEIAEELRKDPRRIEGLYVGSVNSQATIKEIRNLIGLINHSKKK